MSSARSLEGGSADPRFARYVDRRQGCVAKLSPQGAPGSSPPPFGCNSDLCGGPAFSNRAAFLFHGTVNPALTERGRPGLTGATSKAMTLYRPDRREPSGTCFVVPPIARPRRRRTGRSAV